MTLSITVKIAQSIYKLSCQRFHHVGTLTFATCIYRNECAPVIRSRLHVVVADATPMPTPTTTVESDLYVAQDCLLNMSEKMIISSKGGT